jgi:hypothetical protein
MNEKNMLNTNLDPEVEKIRDQIISKIGDKPLDEVNQIIKKLLMENMDETMRLAALAARVKIIRSKISLLYDDKMEINKPKTKQPAKEILVEKPNIKEEKWVRIKMLESGEVNGKQIDKDVILDVKEEDSKILIDAKKAEIVVEKSEKTDKPKPDPTKKADISSEKKESIKVDGTEEAENNKSDNEKMRDNKSAESINESEQNIEDTNKKDLLDKHVKKEKDNKIENSSGGTDENKQADSAVAAPSSEDKPAEEAKKAEDKPAEKAAPSSEDKPAEEAKAEDKKAEPAASSSEDKPAEEAKKAEDKPAEKAAPSSEDKPAEEAKAEDKKAEPAASSSEDKPVDEANNINKD